MCAIAIAAIGTQLKRGDGGVGAGVKASKTIGTVNQQLKVSAKNAGTYANTKTFGIVISGANTAYSQVITANSVLINGATDGSSISTTTVLQAIANLYEDATFGQYFDASKGSGNGSGVLAAGAAGVLSGGTYGTEVFTLIPGVIDLGGPNRQNELVDVTSHDSPNYYREFLPILRDGGQVSGELNYLPSNTQHNGLSTDFENRTLRNFTITFPDGTLVTFAAYVETFEITSPIDTQLKASFGLKITGAPTIQLPS